MSHSRSFTCTLVNIALLTAMLAAPDAAHATALWKCISNMPEHAVKPGWQPSQSGNDIPAAYWGQWITAMKPVRVFTDRVNVAVVTAQTATHESGFYFVVPESSHLPSNVDPKRRFVCSNAGEHLKFTFLREDQGPQHGFPRTPSPAQKR